MSPSLMPRAGREIRQPYGGVLAVGIVTLLSCLVLVALWRVFGGSLAEEPRMRVGIGTSAEYEPLALARAHDVLDPERVLVVEFSSDEDLINAFLDGNVHAGVFPLDEALRLCESPQAAQVLCCVGVTRAPIVLMTGPRGPDLAALRGRRIGLESGRRTMTALRVMLAGAGIALRDVKLRQLDMDSAPVSLERGEVDAIVTCEPGRQTVEREGGRTLASWEPELPGEPLVLIANDRASQEAGGQLAHLRVAWSRGVECLGRLDPADAAIVARREAIPPARVAEELALVRFFAPASALEAPASRDTILAYLGVIADRWRMLGVRDSVPPPARWLAAGPGARR
jgi:hypothetical protein